MKKFLISIDTEGDNQWAWKKGDEIHTENAKYLQRFQDLCEDYGFVPTYLTNYEMALDSEYQKFARRFLDRNTGEIGMHLHAWNTKPEYFFTEYNDSRGASFLIEYPTEIMEAKICTMHDALEQVFQRKIITHRAGRWAMDERYFNLLAKYDYTVDCSVTPHINWENTPGESKGSKGTDYSNAPEVPYIVDEQNKLIEIPVTIRKSHAVFPAAHHTIKSKLGKYIKACRGQYLWLRPNGRNLEHMLWLLNAVNDDEKTDYIMFMLHSSEFMPGGSPTFKTKESIDVLFEHLNHLFKTASKDFEGISIGDYGVDLLKSMNLKG